MLVIGILAGVAAPKMLSNADDAAVKGAAHQLMAIATAAELCFEEQGVWPWDTAAGATPTLLKDYLRPSPFTAPPPVGGFFDWDRDRHGVTAAIKIVSPQPTLAQMLAIDTLLDDGDLATGRVVNSDGFKLIIEP